jgi:hypothetical protein
MEIGMSENSALKKMKDQLPDPSPERAGAQTHPNPTLRNHFGHTWREHEKFLETKLADLPLMEREREMRIQKAQFDMSAAAAPAFERRLELVEAAYRATRPEDRAHYVESIEHDWT